MSEQRPIVEQMWEDLCADNTRLRTALRELERTTRYYFNANELDCEVCKVRDCGECAVCQVNTALVHAKEINDE